MKKIWIIVGALGLCGCGSDPEPAPEPSAVAAPVAPAAPQITPTATTPAFFRQTPTPVPFSIENSVADGALGGSASAPTEQKEKREQVRSLRYDISAMESQKRALNQRKEDLIKDGHPDHPDAGGPNYDENIRQRDDTIARKQKEIDDIMLGQ